MFKDTATDHLARMHQIKAVLEHYGRSVMMLSETRVGYVIHDDTPARIRFLSVEPLNRRNRTGFQLLAVD